MICEVKAKPLYHIEIKYSFFCIENPFLIITVNDRNRQEVITKILVIVVMVASSDSVLPIKQYHDIINGKYTCNVVSQKYSYNNGIITGDTFHLKIF